MGDSTGDGVGNGELYPMGRGDSAEALEEGGRLWKWLRGLGRP